MNEFIAFPVGERGWVRGEGGMTSGRRAAISSGLGFRFSSSGYLPRRRCQKLKHRSAKVAQILNASPFIYLAVEQLFRVTMWARLSGWLWGGCGLAKRGELWGQAGVNWEVARVPKQLFPAGSILN